MADSPHQPLLDQEHLRLLSIGYLIAAAVNVVWMFFPLIYVAMGVMIIFGGFEGNDQGAKTAGALFATIGLVLSLIFMVLAALKFLTARAIRARKSRTLCLVTAGITCLGIPYGTALGVATFMVLTRPSVIELFSQSDSRGNHGR
jgi:hypothetical protein